MDVKKNKWGSRYDVTLNHKDAQKYVRENGYESFINEIDKEVKRDLYCSSVHWEDDEKYICKMRGTRGDVIIGWRDED